MRKPRGRTEKPAKPSGSEPPAEPSGPEPAAEPPGSAQDEAQKGPRNRAWEALEFWGKIGGEAGIPFCGRIGGEAEFPFSGRPSEGAGPLDPAAALSQAMLMAACAPTSAMYAANHADALMFFNAVANQQKTNILGMCVTAKCVRYMFGEAEDDFDFMDPLGNE